MYKERVNRKWGLKKNYKRKDRELIIRMLDEAGPARALPYVNGEPVNMKKISRHRTGSKVQGELRRRSSSASSLETNTVSEEAGLNLDGGVLFSEYDPVVENNISPLTLPRTDDAHESVQERQWQQSSSGIYAENDIGWGQVDPATFNTSFAHWEPREPVEDTLPLNLSGTVDASDEVNLTLSSFAPSQPYEQVENTHLPLTLSRTLDAPDSFKSLEYILGHIDQYYLSCFRGQGQLFSHPVLGSVAARVIEVDDGFTDMGLLEIHDPGYAAISLAKSHQYREARILLGEAQDKLKDLLRAQHPTLLPFILEIICEDSTTPEFNVSESFRRYVCDLCGVIMGTQHPLTMILQLLGLVDHKLETCAMILSKIQTTLSAEFGASQWEARRPVKVFCRVLRHLGRYDEIEQILLGAYDGLETPSQSELLGLLYELAWLSARGRHDKTAAIKLFMEILHRTGRNAETGHISHFRIKALRGLGVLAREESRHEVSEQYFSAALRESKRGYRRRDSNTVRIGNELEETLRKLGRIEEADQLRRERDELFLVEDEEAVLI